MLVNYLSKTQIRQPAEHRDQTSHLMESHSQDERAYCLLEKLKPLSLCLWGGYFTLALHETITSNKSIKCNPGACCLSISYRRFIKTFMEAKCMKNKCGKRGTKFGCDRGKSPVHKWCIIKRFSVNNLWNIGGLTLDLGTWVDYVSSEKVIIKADFSWCRKLP